MGEFNEREWFKKQYLAEDSLNDKAKRYFIQKVSRGEIDTLPENPKQVYMEDLVDQRELNELKDLIMILGGEWSNKGLENKDIVDYFEVLVDQLVRM
tara:strand:+ start:1313 stop:1603 length:291 start_codon:yes stop_codon:yes gene_type:complete